MRNLFFIVSALFLLISISAFTNYSDGLHDYLRGRYTQAFQKLSPLAREGDSQAQYLLGSMFATGKGVKKNLVRAYALFRLAGDQNHEKAKLYREEISWEMSSSQLREAEKLADKWKSMGKRSEKQEPKEKPVEKKTLIAIQKHLRLLGYYSGPIDGLMGPNTRQAIRKYQRNQGLPPNGKASHALLKELRQTLAEQPEQKLISGLPQGPWKTVLFHEDFSDGNYHSNPAWSVASGDFWISPDSSLRTERPLPQRAETSESQSAEETVLKIFGQVVNEVLTPQQSAAPPEVSEIYLRHDLKNVFALQMHIELLSEQYGQNFAFGPFASLSRDTGYLLRLSREDLQLLELIRVERSGRSIIHRIQREHLLKTGRPSTITWLRYNNGFMEIRIDDTSVLQARDRMFNAFEGITLINSGGDYSISSITAFGPDGL